MSETQVIEKKLSRVFVMPNYDHDNLILTANEIEFFKVHGFLINIGLIDSTACERVLDRVWKYLFDHVVDENQSALTRDNSLTWRNLVWRLQAKADTSGFDEGRPPIVAMGNTVKLHDLGSEELIVDLLPRNNNVRAVATLLLSAELRPSCRTRGVYGLFPNRTELDASKEKSDWTKQLGPHCDQVCQQLNVCTYLEDVAPRSGAFTVYPGSHRIMYRAHEYDANWSPRASFRDALADVVNTIEPYELVARKRAM